MPKKERKWVVAPRPGPHKKFESIPLQVILRDILKIVEQGSEARKIIKAGEVFVDGKVRKDHAYPVGLFDPLAIPKLKKFYRVMPTEIGLSVVEISEKEAKEKICRIEKITALKKVKVQLNLNDGKNILVSDGKYKTGDSILLALPSLKILQHFQLKKGSSGIVLSGENSGKIGKVKEIIAGTARSNPRIIYQIDSVEKEIARKDFIVVGE